MGWAVMIAFLITAYIPDPLPWVEELGLSFWLVSEYKSHAVGAVIIMGVLFFLGIPPVGLVS